MKVLLSISIAVFIFSSAFAQTWTQTSAPTNAWVSVASSADGTKLAAAATFGNHFGTGQIYTSTNSGLTWIVQSNAPATNWTCIASSADGTKLVAVENTTIYGETNSPFIASGIYTSTDSGVTWTLQTNAPNAYWTSIVSSPAGNRLAAAAAFGSVYLSSDAGTNWMATALPTNFLWQSIATSTDGSKLVVAGAPGPIYVSTNSGATWTNTGAPSTNWTDIASSVDGTKFAATSFQNGFYISTNSGINWSQLLSAPYTPESNWFAVTFSANGKMIAAGVGAPIYVSMDSGATWITNESPSQAWETIASSADGNKLVAASWARGIWMAQSTPSPQLEIAASNGLAISWIIPSTNFVLQQSSDLSNWTDVTNTPILNLMNLENQVFPPLTGSQDFYRLNSQ